MTFHTETDELYESEGVTPYPEVYPLLFVALVPPLNWMALPTGDAGLVTECGPVPTERNACVMPAFRPKIVLPFVSFEYQSINLFQIDSATELDDSKTLIESGLVATFDAESCTRTTNAFVEVVAAVVPLTTPEGESERPAGSAPESMPKEYGGMPPDAPYAYE
jgi:hypothetical protein